MVNREFLENTQQSFVEACKVKDAPTACTIIDQDFVRNCEIQADVHHSKFLGSVLAETAQDKENKGFVQSVLDYVERNYPEEPMFHFAVKDSVIMVGDTAFEKHVTESLTRIGNRDRDEAYYFEGYEDEEPIIGADEWSGQGWDCDY